MHHSILSHDDMNRPQLIDEPLYKHLKGLYENGDLDNSLVIVMADHGHRFSALRETQQGMIYTERPLSSNMRKDRKFAFSLLCGPACSP